jgi:tRNA-specific 2-thiouridylase
MRARVLVAMSGGVDSSVAAAVLVAQGYDVVGVTMQLFCHGDAVPDRPCCSLDSMADAARVCAQLGVPHYVLNLEPAFGHDVIDDFVSEYARGRTPIPCVRCNTFTKFRDLVRRADAIDAPYVATGHYARAAAGSLFRGRAAAKDQSYFLWGIERAVVGRLLLPIGELTKAETRAHARALGLGVADKVESQDICFVPDGDHVAVVARRLGAQAPALLPGPFVTIDGRVVGTHDGFARYTVGQRRGLPGGSREPLYVVAIRPADRAVVIGSRCDLLGGTVIARGINWLVDAAPSVGTRVVAQIRHRARGVPARVARVTADEIELALDEPVAAIAPGQSLVLYDADRVLGGGVIEAAPSARAPLPVLA